MLPTSSLGAEEPHLFLDAEDNLDIAVGRILCPQVGKDGQDDRDPGLVVRSEHGFTVAVNDALAEDRRHSLGGTDGIHVGAEQNDGSGGVSRHPDNDVARVAAGLRGRIVDQRFQSQLPESCHQIAGHRSFPAGGAVQ
jgi:hypothetical protein